MVQLNEKKQSWRSSELDEFFCTLDSRADTVSKTARKPRVLGSPVECEPPPGCPSWMIKRAEVDEDNQ